MKRHERGGGRRWPQVLQPPLPTHAGCFLSKVVSSPGLRAPINSQPYGFQLWVLADVCPTLRSIWHAEGGDSVSSLGSLGDSAHILIISLHQVGWCFFPGGEIMAQCGCYLYMKVMSVACRHSWESANCSSLKPAQTGRKQESVLKSLLHTNVQNRSDINQFISDRFYIGSAPFYLPVICRRACLDLILLDNKALGHWDFSQASWSPLRTRRCFFSCQHPEHNTLLSIWIAPQTFILKNSAIMT